MSIANFKSALARLLLLLPSALLLAGCANNPMTGRSQAALVTETAAISQSLKSYTALVDDLNKKGKISQDEALKVRIATITDRLIGQALRFKPDANNWAWNVEVIDDPETVNAFCMPGGKMAIYTGLISKLEASDDEIAQVMGHEIAHAIANHGAEKMSVQMMSNLAVMAISAAGKTNNDRQVRQNVASVAALAFINLPNSREAESEADRLGVELAARAGYDPAAAISLWQKMARESGTKTRFDFFSTHPAPMKRSEELASLQKPMTKFYLAAQAQPPKTQVWTRQNANETEVGKEPAQGLAEAAPLAFYSDEMDRFEQGESELACTECSVAFFVKKTALQEAYGKADWRVLARETIKTNYRFDLGYFYLSAAAKGMGFVQASQKYLSKAGELAADKATACAAALMLSCNGIDIKLEAGKNVVTLAK